MKRGRHWTPEDLAALRDRQMSRRWTAEDMSALRHKAALWPASSRRDSKYGNVRVERDGLSFDSTWEADCWTLLQLRQRAGEIHSLSRQVVFPLTVEGRLIGTYVADFTFKDRVGTLHICDAKSKPTRTPLFRWKAKHVAAQYGIDIELLERPQ